MSRFAGGGLLALGLASAVMAQGNGAAPEMVSRDAQGGVTMRAVRLDEPLVFDGRLDDAIYQRVPQIGELIFFRTENRLSGGRAGRFRPPRAPRTAF